MENSETQKILELLHKLSTQVEELKVHQKSSAQQECIPSRSSLVNELFTALAKAQGEMQVADLNRENPYFKSRYADLKSVVQASRPALAKYGLSVIQNILINDDGQSILHTILAHNSGQYIESRMRIVPPKNDIQTISSYTTYLKRMAYASLVGVVTGDEDDDGEVAMVEARHMVVKGPTTKYNPKEQSYETITKEQLDELRYELAEYPDLEDEIISKLNLQSLSDMPKSKFMASAQRIREIKQARNGR